MKFLTLSSPGVRIRLSPGVSQFTVNPELTFVKNDNKLFKISGNSQNDVFLKIFEILKQPRKYSQIQNSLSQYRKKDLSNLIQLLLKLQLVEYEDKVNSNQLNTVPSDGKARLVNKSRRRSIRGSGGSQVLLIGNGILANKLNKRLGNSNISIKRISTVSDIDSVLEGSNSRRTKKIEQSQSPESFLSSLIQSRLVLAAEDFANISFFEKLNKICIEHNRAWLRVCFDDKLGYVGPFVIPGKSSCFLCCELRIVTNSPLYERQLWKYKENIPHSKLTVSEQFVDILSAIATNEIETYFNGSEPSTVDNMFTFDTRQIKLSKHRIVAHPNCEFGNLSLKSKLQFSKRLGRNTGLKDFSGPEVRLNQNELLERLKVIEDEKTGIIVDSGKVYDTNSLGINFHFFHFVTLYRPLRIGFEKKAHTNLESEDNLLIPSPSGSGSTPDDAKLRAIMESVERYSNMIVEESRFKWSSYNNVKNRAINPIDLGLYSENHYERNPTNYSRFSPLLKIPWIEGHDLTSGRRILVPADFVHYPAFRQRPLVRDTSNGSASHSSTIDAILNGLYEVMERDAFLIMWLNRISMPIIELDSLPFGFDESVKLINYY
jgi:bacteriocin biosynthesis cyclodehydratase domain-containing protein